MVSPFKTDNRESNFLKGSIKPFKTLSLISASVALTALVGCGSVQFGPNSAEEPVSPPVVEASGEAVEEEVVTTQDDDKKSVASEQDADKLMASLKAPVVEPGADGEPENDSSARRAEVKEVVNDASLASKEDVNGEGVVASADEAKKDSASEAVVEPNVVTENMVTEQVVMETEAVQQTEVVASGAEQVVEKAAEIVEPVVEKVKELVKKTVKGAAKPLAISKNDLPATYDIWVLKQGETVHTEGLVISTPTWEMGKEGYMSQIWLTLKEDALHVNSSSDIATKVKGLGVSIDGGELIPFTKVLENKIAVVEGDWLDTLANAQKLDIYLGFFPGKKPRSDRFKSDTSLDNLDRVVATYRKLK